MQRCPKSSNGNYYIIVELDHGLLDLSFIQNFETHHLLVKLHQYVKELSCFFTINSSSQPTYTNIPHHSTI